MLVQHHASIRDQFPRRILTNCILASCFLFKLDIAKEGLPKWNKLYARFLLPHHPSQNCVKKVLLRKDVVDTEFRNQIQTGCSYSGLKPLTCRILICLTIVLFPDSPAPADKQKEGGHPCPPIGPGHVATQRVLPLRGLFRVQSRCGYSSSP